MFKKKPTATVKPQECGRTELIVDNNTPDLDVLTLEEAALYLRCCGATLKRRAEALHIPHKRLGSLWRFYRPDLEAWMRNEESRDKAA
ncbi:MAG: helix-turn-helix domain-containing protein [Terracidiphilus sp.]